MNRIINFLKTTAGGLSFSLVCGLAYFIIILNFIVQYSGNHGMLLGFFFFPAIICGVALVLVKVLKNWYEEEQYKSILALFWAHVGLILMSIVFLLSFIM